MPSPDAVPGSDNVSVPAVCSTAPSADAVPTHSAPHARSLVTDSVPLFPTRTRPVAPGAVAGLKFAASAASPVATFQSFVASCAATADRPHNTAATNPRTSVFISFVSFLSFILKICTSSFSVSPCLRVRFHGLPQSFKLHLMERE